MKVDDKLLEKLENLSALKVENKDEIKGQISEILNFVENLNALNLDEKSTKDSAKTPLREDNPKQSEVIESLLQNAPNAENRFFIVPKIIE